MSDIAPRFRLDKKVTPPRVFLQCSKCEVDIREIKPTENIKVTRAYYCDKCDPGVIVLNIPKDE